MSSSMLCVTPPFPKLICREQSLCRYLSTSSATSSSESGSPRTSSLLLSPPPPPSLPPRAAAATPSQGRSRRPGPKGENRVGSRNPMGLHAGSVSEYEYRKSKGRSECAGSSGLILPGWDLGFGAGVEGAPGGHLGIRVNGGSSLGSEREEAAG
uniref:Uncharacterized protein n=1 Tax=Arundo donax TaxID=35708 RepID=A0A0A9DT24_ARUDO